MTARAFARARSSRTASTIGALSFHRGRGRRLAPPRLRGRHPARRSSRRRRRSSRRQSAGAPPRGRSTLVRPILQDVREGRTERGARAASPVFKGSVSLEAFKAVLQSHRAELGNFVRVLGIISSAQSPDRDRARVQAVLEYERGKTTGTFEFMRLDAAWRLLGFKVVIPFGETQPDQRPL